MQKRAGNAVRTFQGEPENCIGPIAELLIANGRITVNIIGTVPNIWQEVAVA